LNVKKFVVLAFVLVLLSTAVVIGLVRPVVARGTIHIRSDGSVDPPTAPVQRNGNVYTFTDNIYDMIVVERDNIVVDGAGYNLQGTGAWYSKGIDLTGRSNVTINNIEIKEYFFAIWLNTSSSNSIYGNKITNNKVGIWLSDSLNNSIYGNNVTANLNYGIYLGYSSGNSIYRNNVIANDFYGVYLGHSSNNSIYDNDIISNHYEHISDVGIQLSSFSNNNSISGNNLKNNFYGILLWESLNNTIYGNDITKNDNGIVLTNSSNNIIYHNNFVDNTKQVCSYNSTNVWDDGYPPGGNYWSNYMGEDRNGDGVGDTESVIDANDQDNYPLMSQWSPTWSPKPLVEGKVSFWMQWWFWAIAVTGIAVLVGAVYFLKERKPPTPTAPPLPTDDT